MLPSEKHLRQYEWFLLSHTQCIVFLSLDDAECRGWCCIVIIYIKKREERWTGWEMVEVESKDEEKRGNNGTASGGWSSSCAGCLICHFAVGRKLRCFNLIRPILCSDGCQDLPVYFWSVVWPWLTGVTHQFLNHLEGDFYHWWSHNIWLPTETRLMFVL